MTDTVIQVENLSNLYRIGRAQQRHDTLRDAIVDFGTRIGRIAECRIVRRGCGMRSGRIADRGLRIESELR